MNAMKYVKRSIHCVQASTPLPFQNLRADWIFFFLQAQDGLVSPLSSNS